MTKKELSEMTNRIAAKLASGRLASRPMTIAQKARIEALRLRKKQAAQQVDTPERQALRA
jgi:hypothetical protein